MRGLMMAAVLAGLAAPAAAEGWQLTATPYFMAPTMDGKAAVGPIDTIVSTSPSDIFSHLNWGVMGIVELNNGHWGANLDVTYMNLDVTSDDRRYAVNGHQGAYTGTILYRVHEYAELYAGARVNDLGVKLDCNRDCLNVALLHGSRNKTWVDPLVGFRAVLPFNDKFDLTMLADVGGFGVGSDIAVQAWPSLGFKLGRSTKAMLGYRVLYTKYASGAGRDRFVYDVATFGPTVGVQLHF